MISKGKRLTLLGFLLVVIDQVIKIMVKTNMTLGEHFSVFGDWFQILFVENEGMAFGMKFGGDIGKLCLSVFRIVFFILLCWWISRLVKRGTASDPALKDSVHDTAWLASRKVPTGVLVGLTLIAAGALGNIIDCMFYGLAFSASTPFDIAAFGGSYAPFMFGKVVDMFYFPLWTWPDWMPLIGGDIFFQPVFNFADSCVSVGAVYLLLFQYKFFASEDSGA